MAKQNGGKQPPKEDPKRPIINFGPYTTDRNTSVEVAVWENEITVEDRQIMTYNVTVKRSYRDSDGEWHANQNFRPHDLPVVIHGLQRAHAYILEKKTGGEAF